MAAVLMGGFRVNEEPHTTALVGQAARDFSNTRELGKLLYTQYLYPLEVAAAILLGAMIAAIALTLRQRKDSKHMNAADQIAVKAKDRMTVIKMATTQVRPLDDSAAAQSAENKA